MSENEKTKPSFDDLVESRYKSLADQLIDVVITIDVNTLSDTETIRSEVVEEQVEYSWLRIYLNEENEYGFEENDEIKITYVPTGESETFTFSTYEAKGIFRDAKGVLRKSNELDKNTMCLSVNVTKMNKNSDHIPNLRTFFRSSKFYNNPDFIFKEDINLSCEKRGYDNIEHKRVGFKSA